MLASTEQPLPVLKQYANLWTLLHYPGGSELGEWDYDRKLSAIKAAGFQGFQGHAGHEFAELAAKHDLAFLGGCQANEENMEACLRAFVRLKPVRINVHLGDHTMPPDEAARIWVAMNEIGDDLGLLLDLETHRGTCTETPEKTWQIAELYQQKRSRPIRLNLDFSHFAVVKHLEPPYGKYLLDRPELLKGVGQLHLRPFNGHHCEIPATDGSGQVAEWAKPWFEFVEEVLGRWVAENPGDTLWVCPELGAMTSGYWLPSFPDPWKDSIFVKQEIDRIWQSPARKWSLGR